MSNSPNMFLGREEGGEGRVGKGGWGREGWGS